MVFVSAKPHPGAALFVRGPAGVHKLAGQRGGGPPYWWLAEIPRPEVGRHRFALVDPQGTLLACTSRRVEPRPSKLAPLGPEQWAIRRAWGVKTESLYSAWIEKLFHAPAGARPSWTPLHLVIRDPQRNFLFNHHGADEDGPSRRRAVVLKPDCADLPYFLRAYFAWKLGLPFGYRHCDRGNSSRPSRCQELRTNLSVPVRSPRAAPAKRFSQFLRRSVSYVHSGAGRTNPDDDETDLYPVKLTRASLRPGTVYVDPYGHLLIVSRWIDQGPDKSGLLYAVDGHPDLSVGRKRFWRGAFLFSDKIKAGAGGFKAFRPLVVREGKIVALTNDEIRASRNYGDLSDEQYRLGVDGFYDRLEQLINPRPLSPARAFRERMEALFELVMERVGSVQAGEDFTEKTGRATIKMPRGPRIFETSGDWENFSTPARDLRLLIAIEEIRQFPAKVRRQPKRFALPASVDMDAVQKELEQLYQDFTRKKSFTYLRSDKSRWTLTLAEVIRRRSGLEMAYNPNDCAEIRWAAEGKELATCKRHAPAEQSRLMESYRSWFTTRTRPPIR